MNTYKTYTFKLNPTKAQEGLFKAYAGCARFVFNWGLSQRQQYYEATRDVQDMPSALFYYDQAMQLPVLKKQFPFLADAPAGVLQTALMDLERSYQAAFNGDANLPRWRTRKKAISFSAHQRFSASDKHITVPKAGKVKAWVSRPVEGKLKRMTIKQECGNWYAYIIAEITHDPLPMYWDCGPVGIDMGIAHFATLSGGSTYDYPDFSKLKKRLNRAIRSLKRKESGSSNHAKALQRVERIRKKIDNTKTDFLHKASTSISKKHAVVAVEDIHTLECIRDSERRMRAGQMTYSYMRKFNQQILFQRWGTFRAYLKYKMLMHGNNLIVVNPRNTSRLCPSCGHVSKLNRVTQESFKCVKCGYAGNADVIAANNILAVGRTATACGDMGSRLLPAQEYACLS